MVIALADSRVAAASSPAHASETRRSSGTRLSKRDEGLDAYTVIAYSAGVSTATAIEQSTRATLSVFERLNAAQRAALEQLRDAGL